MKNEVMKIEKSTRSGICKYCRQVVMVEAPEDYTAAEVNQLATEQCACKEAVIFRKRKERMMKAAEWAKEHFSDNEKQLQAFCAGIQTVFEYEFDKVTIKKGKETFAIYLDKDGMINISRTYKESSKKEF